MSRDDDDDFDALLAMVARADDVRPDLTAGALVGEHFEIGATLGRGGMGVVYLATDRRLDREVALKVARTSGARERERMRSEAKALAKLTHPHVVTVYEVGSTEDGGVFIAMERIDGGTMRAWLAEEAPGRQERLRVLLEAGRGLQAAHDVGLVHRDFKPENVLIGSDGRARVSDFGLARNLPRAGPHDGERPLDALASLGVGTPGYMAPEQIRGAEIDARADQFAFATVCYEVLRGEHPFDAARTIGDTLEALSQGPPSSRDARAPGSRVGALEGVLAKALADDPADRHDDLGPVLSALSAETQAASRGPSVTRFAVAVGAVVGGVALAASFVDRPSGEDCDAAARQLADAWRSGPRPALVAQGEDAERAVVLMDRYAEAWGSERAGVCRDRPDNEARYRERRACLDDLARSYRAVAAVLASSGRGTDRLRGPNRLFDPALCGSEAFARARAPAPARDVAAVEALRVSIAEVRALEDAARYDAAAQQSARAVSEAKRLAYAPAVVEALYARGRVEARRGEFVAAAKTLEEAYLLARRAPHDRLAAEIGGELAYLFGFNLSDVSTAKRWADLALADMERLGGAGPFEARVLTNVGSANAWSGELELALSQHRRALKLALAHRGEDHVEVAGVRARLGETLASMQRVPAAIAALESAIATLERSFGKVHPELVRPLTKLGLVRAEQGDIEAAIASCRRAVEVAEQSLGARHANTGLAQMNLGVVYLHAGRRDEAVAAYEAAVAALEAALHPEHPDLALVRTNLGLAYEENGQYAEALGMHEKALELQRRRLGPDHPSLVPTLLNQLSALIGLRRYEDAVPLARKALKICETDYPRGTPFALFSLGQAQIGSGDHAGAVASFDRALTLRRETDTAPRYLAETLLFAARAVRALGEDRSRARSLAEEGIEVLGDLDEATPNRLRDELEAFLRR